MGTASGVAVAMAEAEARAGMGTASGVQERSSRAVDLEIGRLRREVRFQSSERDRYKGRDSHVTTLDSLSNTPSLAIAKLPCRVL